MNASPRYEDHVTFQSVTPRQVNTRNGVKTVWDIVDDRGRKLQTWNQELSQQAFNLVGQPVRIEYVEKPSSDPQYPPNLQLELIQPTGMAGPGAAAVAQQAAPAPQPQQAAPQPMQAAPSPMQAAPLPAAQGTAGAGTGGVSEHDKECMRRSAAVKAAAMKWSADPDADFWMLVNEILVFIETGNDPIPFEAGQQPGVVNSGIQSGPDDQIPY